MVPEESNGDPSPLPPEPPEFPVGGAAAVVTVVAATCVEVLTVVIVSVDVVEGEKVETVEGGTAIVTVIVEIGVVGCPLLAVSVHVEKLVTSVVSVLVVNVRASPLGAEYCCVSVTVVVVLSIPLLHFRAPPVVSLSPSAASHAATATCPLNPDTASKASRHVLTVEGSASQGLSSLLHMNDSMVAISGDQP